MKKQNSTVQRQVRDKANKRHFKIATNRNIRRLSSKEEMAPSLKKTMAQLMRDSMKV